MEIEQKEKERIEAYATAYGEGFKTGEFFEKIRIEATRQGMFAEHIYLQKEVIQPLAQSAAGYKRLYEASLEKLTSALEDNSKLEAEVKALRGMFTQISAWLSFNTNPSAEELAKMKNSIDQLLKNEG